MTGPQTFCERLSDFLLRFKYSNDMIIHEDQYGRMGRGNPIGLLISHRPLEPKDFERARKHRLKVVCENTSFGLRCFLVPARFVRQEDIPRLLHCEGPPLYARY